MPLCIFCIFWLPFHFKCSSSNSINLTDHIIGTICIQCQTQIFAINVWLCNTIVKYKYIQMCGICCYMLHGTYCHSIGFCAKLFIVVIKAIWRIKSKIQKNEGLNSKNVIINVRINNRKLKLWCPKNE